MRNRQSTDLLGGPVLVVKDSERDGIVLNWDASGSFADRARFDAAPSGFSYMVVDPLPFTMYVKRTAGFADWSAGQEVKGNPADSTVAAQEARNDALFAANAANGSAFAASSSAGRAAGHANTALSGASAAAQQAALAAQQVSTAQSVANEASIAAANARAYAAQVGRQLFDFNIPSEYDATNDWNN